MSPEGAFQHQPRATPWDSERALQRAHGISPKGAFQRQPRATPWDSERALQRVRDASPKGAIQHQPRATPWDKNPPFAKALKGRSKNPGWPMRFHS